MEKNFKRLIIANGVLFAFAILAMIISDRTRPARQSYPESLWNPVEHLW